MIGASCDCGASLSVQSSGLVICAMCNAPTDECYCGHRATVEGDRWKGGFNAEWDLDDVQMTLGYCIKCGQQWPCRKELLRQVAELKALHIQNGDTA